MKRILSNLSHALTCCLMILLAFGMNYSVNAQTSCTSITGFTGSHNTQFRVQNTNTFDIMITGVSSNMSTFSAGSTKDFKLLYNPAPIDYPGGGPIGSGVGGWLDAGPIASVAIPSSPPSTPITVMTGLTLIIPAGATYTFMLATTNNAVAVASTGSTLVEATTGGVKILTGGPAGYVGDEDIFYTSGTPPYNYWGFLGCVEFVPVSTEPCAGIPDGGTSSSSPSSGGTMEPFTLSASGYTFTLDMSYQWEISEDGVTWTEIPGATTTTYMATSISTPGLRFYRLRVTCEGTGEVGYSSTTTYESMNILCNGLSMSTTSSHNVIFHVQNTNAYPINVNSVSTRLSDWGGPGSRDFKVMYNPTAILATGGIYPGPVGSGVGGWVDAGPIVSVPIPSPSSMEPVEILSGMDVIIPPGETYTFCIATTENSLAVYSMSGISESTGGGMIIRTGHNISYVGYDDIFYSSGTPSFSLWGFIGCIGFNEVADCTGEPMAGFLTDMSVCPSNPFVVTNAGSTSATGITRIWQSRPVGSTTWTDIAGATMTHLSLPSGITTATEYRSIVTCSFSGLSDTTNISTVNINEIVDCYCIPSASYPTVNYITNVTTTLGITNFANTTSTGSETSPGYSDFFDVHSASAVQGTSFNFSVTETGSLGACKIWIDWNQNGFFTDPGEEVYAYTSTPGLYTFTGTINVPLTALPGETRMRVRTNWEYGIALTPCDLMDYGEAEDYKMIVIEATPCNDPSVEFPTTIVSNASPNMVCGTGNTTLSIVTGMPIASGITYKWQMSSSAAGPWADISTPSLDNDFYYEGITSNTYFRAVVYCQDEFQSYSEVVMVESVIPVTPTLFDGQTCGPGPVELTGTVASGDIFWYSTPTGGSPIGSGTSFITDPLTTTTVFYATGGASPTIDTFVGSTPAYTYSSVSSPFYYGWGGYKHQYLITADELIALGFTSGDIISSIGFKVTSTSIPTIYNSFSISVGLSSTTSLAGAFVDGLTEVYTSPAYTPTTGLNTFIMSTPLIWDGTSNVIVQSCFNNGTSGGTSINVEFSSRPVVAHRAVYNDGSTIEMICGASAGYMTTTYERPNIYLSAAGCETDRIPVTAHVRDVPSINILEEDGTYCLFNNEFELNATPEVLPSQTLLWSSGANTQSITVGPSAPNTKYWVELTDEFGCIASDTVTVSLNPSPEVDLGPDVLICEGGSLSLDAGAGGVSYFWNTGETSRTISVEEDGTFTVLVTNSFECMATDTIQVIVDGFAPEISGIIVENLGGNTFRFSAHLPLYVDSYEWDFGDETSTSVAHSPVHTYTEVGTYEVKLRVTSSCATKEYTTYASIFTDIDKELYNTFKLYPNPTNDYINIQSEGSAVIQSIKISNVLGQNVLDETNLNNGKNVRIDVTRLPSGHYNIIINTDKGPIVKSFNILK